jgi:hypothetical protein
MRINSALLLPLSYLPIKLCRGFRLTIRLHIDLQGCIVSLTPLQQKWMGMLELEPATSVSETDMFPLHQSPMALASHPYGFGCQHDEIYHRSQSLCVIPFGTRLDIKWRRLIGLHYLLAVFSGT